MLKKTIFGALAAATALTAIPTAAEAQYYRDGYYGRHHYRNYPRHRSRSRVYINVGPSYGYGYYGGGYYDPYYSRGYYPYPDRYYGGSYYYPSRYYRSSYYGRRGYRCDDGTTGAIVGGAAGALVGSEIGRDGRRYRYRYGRRGGSATGAIVGGALGALIGSQASRC